MEKEKAVESAIYVGDRWDITSQLSLNVGVRYSMFNVLGPRTYNLYADDQLPSLATVTGTVDKTGRSRLTTGRSSGVRPLCLYRGLLREGRL